MWVTAAGMAQVVSFEQPLKALLFIFCVVAGSFTSTSLSQPENIYWSARLSSDMPYPTFDRPFFVKKYAPELFLKLAARRLRRCSLPGLIGSLSPLFAPAIWRIKRMSAVLMGPEMVKSVMVNFSSPAICLLNVPASVSVTLFSKALAVVQSIAKAMTARCFLLVKICNMYCSIYLNGYLFVVCLGINVRRAEPV